MNNNCLKIIIVSVDVAQTSKSAFIVSVELITVRTETIRETIFR